MTCKDCFHFEVCDSGRHIGEYIEDDGIYSEGVEKECITFIPAADVIEVVRCKDCVHCHISIDPKTKTSVQVCGYVGYNPVQSSQVTDNDYCSHGEGERREE